MKEASGRTRLRTWNRKVHIYLGLYMLLFLWVFAVSGLFMNHPRWFSGQPQRTSVEQPVVMPDSGTDLDQAHDIMGQLDLTGEVVFRGEQTPGEFRFIALRPHVRQFVNVNLETEIAKLTKVRLQPAGVLGDLHVFTGTRGIFREKVSVRDWLPTRIWSFSMDALSIGLLLMVLSSLYMGWQRLKTDRAGVIVSLTLGVTVFVFFMWGLRWMT